MGILRTLRRSVVPLLAVGVAGIYLVVVSGCGREPRGRSVESETAVDSIAQARSILAAAPEGDLQALSRAKAALRAELQIRNARIRERLRELETTPGPAGPRGDIGLEGPAGLAGEDGLDAEPLGMAEAIADAERARERYAETRSLLGAGDLTLSVDAMVADLEDLHARLSTINRNPALMRGSTHLPDELLPEMARVAILDPNPAMQAGGSVSFWRADLDANEWLYDSFGYSPVAEQTIFLSSLVSVTPVVPPPPPTNHGYTIDTITITPGFPLDPPKKISVVLDTANLPDAPTVDSDGCAFVPSTAGAVSYETDPTSLSMQLDYQRPPLKITRLRFAHGLSTGVLFDRISASRALHFIIGERDELVAGFDAARTDLPDGPTKTGIERVLGEFAQLEAEGPTSPCFVATLMRSANEHNSARGLLAMSAITLYRDHRADRDAFYAALDDEGLWPDTPANRDELDAEMERFEATLRAGLATQHEALVALARELAEGARDLEIVMNPDDYLDAEVRQTVTNLEHAKGLRRISHPGTTIYYLEQFPDVVELAQKEMAARNQEIPVMTQLSEWSGGTLGALLSGLATTTVIATLAGSFAAYLLVPGVVKAIAVNMTIEIAGQSLSFTTGIKTIAIVLKTSAAAGGAAVAVTVILFVLLIALLVTAIVATIQVVNSETNRAKYEALVAANPNALDLSALSEEQAVALVAWIYGRPR